MIEQESLNYKNRHIKNSLSIPQLPEQRKKTLPSAISSARNSFYKSRLGKSQIKIDDKDSQLFIENDIQMIYFPQCYLKQDVEKPLFKAFESIMLSQTKQKDKFKQLSTDLVQYRENQLEFNYKQKEIYKQQVHQLERQVFKSTMYEHWASQVKELQMPALRITKRKGNFDYDNPRDRPIYLRALGQDTEPSLELAKPPLRLKAITTRRAHIKSKRKINNEIHQLNESFQVRCTRCYISIGSYDKIEPVPIENTQELIRRPTPRESAALAFCGDTIYLYGGIGPRQDPKFYILGVKDLKWRSLNLPQQEEYFSGQYGHTMINYKNQLLIFGGCRRLNLTPHIRECLNDVIHVNPKEKTIRRIQAYGQVPEKRRNHAAVMVGKFLVIIGGISQIDKYLDNIFCLNLDNNLWLKVETKNFFENQGIAFHCAFLVQNPNVKYDGPFVKQETPSLKRRFPEEGIFIYGGLIGDNTINKQLHLLKLGSETISCKPIPTRGKQPQPRYNATMSYFEDNGIAIFVGGKNDEFGVLSDISILDMETLVWNRVECYGYRELTRCFHTSTQFGSKVIIFGGYDKQKYATTDIVVIETVKNIHQNLSIKDQVQVKMKVRQYNLKAFLIGQPEDIKKSIRFDDKIHNQVPNSRILEMNQISEDEETPSPLKSTGERRSISQLVQALNIKNFKSQLLEI